MLWVEGRGKKTIRKAMLSMPKIFSPNTQEVRKMEFSTQIGYLHPLAFTLRQTFSAPL